MSSLGNAIAGLGALGRGYAQGRDMYEDRKIKERKRQEAEQRKAFGDELIGKYFTEDPIDNPSPASQGLDNLSPAKGANGGMMLDVPQLDNGDGTRQPARAPGQTPQANGLTTQKNRGGLRLRDDMSFDDLANSYNELRMRAATIPGAVEQYEPLFNSIRNYGVSQYVAGFDIDRSTPKGAAEYATRVGEAEAKFGIAEDPDKLFARVRGLAAERRANSADARAQATHDLTMDEKGIELGMKRLKAMNIALLSGDIGGAQRYISDVIPGAVIDGVDQPTEGNFQVNYTLPSGESGMMDLMQLFRAQGQMEAAMSAKKEGSSVKTNVLSDDERLIVTKTDADGNITTTDGTPPRGSNTGNSDLSRTALMGQLEEGAEEMYPYPGLLGVPGQFVPDWLERAFNPGGTSAINQQRRDWIDQRMPQQEGQTPPGPQQGLTTQPTPAATPRQPGEQPEPIETPEQPKDMPKAQGTLKLKKDTGAPVIIDSKGQEIPAQEGKWVIYDGQLYQLVVNEDGELELAAPEEVGL